MADKRRVKHNIRRLQQVKTWQLLIILILASLLSATFLRLNNIGMIERRSAVISADRAGDNAQTGNSLIALQRYVSAHMNADSDPLYLEGSYNRDVKKAVDKAKAADVANRDAVAKADETCRQQFPGYSPQYVQCNAAEQAKYSGQDVLNTTAQFPNPALYRKDFVGPLWSPDFAGWSLVACAIVAIVIILRLVSLLILKALLRRHYSSI